MMRLLILITALLGLLLLVAVVWLYVRPPIDSNDAAFAFTPVYQIPLPELQQNRSLDRSFSIPAGDRWKRLFRAWGNPGYVVTAISSDQGTTYCLERLGIDVEVIVGSGLSQALPATDPLYAHRAECLPIGVKFEANADEPVTLKVTTRASSLPPGYLSINAYWKSDVKDKLVGVSLDRELRQPTLIAAGLGLLLVAVACALVLRRL